MRRPVSYTHLDVYKRQYQDYNMLMALCMLTGACVLVFHLAAQLLSEFIDPRMKREEALI